MSNSEDLDYYSSDTVDPRGIRYRLDSHEVIEDAIDRVRGGFKLVAGKKIFNNNQRMMNEEGIAALDFFLRGAVNKISHLTNFDSEARVMIQIKHLANAYLTEITLCMKKWAPDAWTQEVKTTKEYRLPDGSSFVKERSERVYMNPTRDRVKNPRLILQIVENAILSSYQRGRGGFEATNLVKSWQVNEMIGKQPGEQEEESRIKRMFGLGGQK